MNNNQSIGTIGHAEHGTHEYAQYITDSERLAAYAGARFDEEMSGEDESPIVSRPPHGFTMPSMAAVRDNDARLMAHGAPCNVASEEEDEEEDEESALREQVAFKRRDSMREHSLLMPSQRGFREAWSEAASYGYAND